jgi:hypothetical protein
MAISVPVTGGDGPSPQQEVREGIESSLLLEPANSPGSRYRSVAAWSKW